MPIILDTSVWIEFFQGTDKSKFIEIMLRKEECFTSIVTFSELVNWCIKNNIKDKINPYIEGIKKGSKILGLNESIVILAGELNYKRKQKVRNWGMLDSFILATALIYALKILTKDSHFKDLENIQLL